MIFQCACQVFPYWRTVVPTVAKNSIISPTVESIHHNLITYTYFSITKESNCQNNSLSNFPPTASKNTLPTKIPSSSQMSSSQLLLTLFRWLHEMNTFLQFNKLQTPLQKSCGSSIKGCSAVFAI